MPRYSRETECAGKRQYPSRKAARVAAHRTNARFGIHVEPYRCSWCDWHHVGHPPAIQAGARHAS